MGKRVLAIVVSALLGLAACGGDKKVTSESDQPTTAAAERTATTGETTDSRTGSVPVLNEQCQQFVAFASAFGAAMAAAADPDAAAKLEQAKEAFDVEKVPADLRDDVEVMIDFATGLGKVWAEHQTTSGSVDPEAFAAFATYIQGVDQDKIRTANDHIQAWVDSNCPS